MDFKEWFDKACEYARKAFGQDANFMRRQFAKMYERKLPPEVAVKEVYGDLVD